MLKNRILLVAYVVGLAACDMQQEDDHTNDPAGEVLQDIVGGTATTGDPAVVAIAFGNQAFCSGTLIGKQTVLTAAHCFQDAAPNTTGFRVLFGSKVVAPGTDFTGVDVAQFFIHPQYDGQPGNGRDATVLKLATPVANIKPIRINTTPLTNADVGKQIRHVGFGLSDGVNRTGFGTKRQATFPVRSVTAPEVESGSTTSQTCNGDSGGPGFMVTAGNSQERVVGIVSYGDQQCRITGFDTRVDAVANFIMTTAAAWENLGTCAADGVCHEGCLPTPDPDCACAADGVCGAQCTTPALDVDCKGLGAACTTADQCAGRQCITDPQHPQLYCSQSCAANAPCPNGFSCVGAVCQHVQVPETPLGQTCTAASRCAQGGICAGPAGGPLTCVLSCKQGACPISGVSCQLGANNVEYCIAPTSTQTPGTETPGTQTPGTQTPGTQTPGTQTPGTHTHDTQAPSVEVPDGQGGTDSSDEGASTGSSESTSNPRGTGSDGLTSDASLPTYVNGGCSAAGAGSPLFLLALGALATRRRAPRRRM